MIRALHKLYANLFGYFWRPCPVCGKHFGGHESVTDGASLMTGAGVGKVVCSVECSKKAEAANAKNGFYWPIKA